MRGLILAILRALENTCKAWAWALPVGPDMPIYKAYSLGLIWRGFIKCAHYAYIMRDKMIYPYIYKTYRAQRAQKAGN
jgi:hypothetical protein